MFKYLKVSSILIAAIFVLSFSTAQAGGMGADKSCCNKSGKDKVCDMESAKSNCSKSGKDKACAYKDAKLIKLSSAESGNTEEVVLNVRGMTCGGCANKVKGALIECEGVKDAQVNHKDGKAVVEVAEGKANKEKLIEAVEKVGFSASEG